jgi:glycerol-3-phosphate dehydrogenase subunit B
LSFCHFVILSSCHLFLFSRNSLFMHDLLVIGAGLAGLSAALAAAEAGLRVHVIAKGLGVTHWHAGTIDVLGYLPGDASPLAEPLAQLDNLPAQHPYRQLGATTVVNALRWFHAFTQEIGLPYGPAQDTIRNTLLPSPVGAPRPTALAPHAQLTGDLQSTSPMVIVGLQGWRDFYPALMAANLTKLGQPARAAFIPVDTLTNRRDFNTVHLADAFDQPATQARWSLRCAR